MMWVCPASSVHAILSIVMAYPHSSVMYTRIRACFLYFFYNPYMSLLIQRIFHLLVIYGIHTICQTVVFWGQYSFTSASNICSLSGAGTTEPSAY